MARERVAEARAAAHAQLVASGAVALAARLEEAALGLLGLLRAERALIEALAASVREGA